MSMLINPNEDAVTTFNQVKLDEHQNPVVEQSIRVADDIIRIKLKVEIRKNADGAIATDVWDDWPYHTWWWSEGNAACDCNREAFFLRAIGEPVLDGESIPCGEDRFSVRLSNADTGEVLYDEFEIGVSI